jgi:hypothetical protein
MWRIYSNPDPHGVLHLDIFGISECRWTGAGRMEKSRRIYSGNEELHEAGVAVIN